MSNQRETQLEQLQARVEALEAQAGNLKGSLTSSTPPPVATDEERLIGRVSFAIMSVEDDDDDDPSFKYTSAAIELGMDLSSLQARAAILEVARWLREQGWFGAADLFEQEAGR